LSFPPDRSTQKWLQSRLNQRKRMPGCVKDSQQRSFILFDAANSAAGSCVM
jgi:hypothetical protein